MIYILCLRHISWFLHYFLQIKKIRMELLGIGEELYLDKEKAKEWHHRIAKIIHPDTCKVEGCERAIMKLNELYAGMVKADE